MPACGPSRRAVPLPCRSDFKGSASLCAGVPAGGEGRIPPGVGPSFEPRGSGYGYRRGAGPPEGFVTASGFLELKSPLCPRVGGASWARPPPGDNRRTQGQRASFVGLFVARPITLWGGKGGSDVTVNFIIRLNLNVPVLRLNN